MHVVQIGLTMGTAVVAAMLLAGACSSGSGHGAASTTTSSYPTPTLAALRAAVVHDASAIVNGQPANVYWDLSAACRSKWPEARYEAVLRANLQVIRQHQRQDDVGAPQGPPTVRSVSVRSLSGHHAQVDVALVDSGGNPSPLAPYLPGGTDFESWEWSNHSWHPACPTSLTLPSTTTLLLPPDTPIRQVPGAPLPNGGSHYP